MELYIPRQGKEKEDVNKTTQIEINEIMIHKWSITRAIQTAFFCIPVSKTQQQLKSGLEFSLVAEPRSDYEFIIKP